MNVLLSVSSVLAMLVMATAAFGQYPVYSPYYSPYAPSPYAPSSYVTPYVYYPPVYTSTPIVALFTGQTAYTKSTPLGTNVVLNGIDGPLYFSVSSLAFSPNGARLLYLAQSVPGGPWSLVVDGVMGPPYASISSPIFSPNSARVAYLAQGVPGGPWFAVVDGMVGPPYATVNRLAFSSDSVHVAYDAWSTLTRQWLAVADGVAYPMDSVTGSTIGAGSGITFMLDPFSGQILPPPMMTGGSTNTPPISTVDSIILGRPTR
jgi:hypothetical protein